MSGITVEIGSHTDTHCFHASRLKKEEKVDDRNIAHRGGSQSRKSNS